MLILLFRYVFAILAGARASRESEFLVGARNTNRFLTSLTLHNFHRCLLLIRRSEYWPNWFFAFVYRGKLHGFFASLALSWEIIEFDFWLLDMCT